MKQRTDNAGTNWNDSQNFLFKLFHWWNEADYFYVVDVGWVVYYNRWIRRLIAQLEGSAYGE